MTGGPRTLTRMLAGAAGDRRARRTPFILLVVALLAAGLIVLLLLNASVNQGAFQLAHLKKQTTQYTDEQQTLQQAIEQDSAPGTLAARAARLGMVPGGNPAFLAPSGAVRGVPGAAAEPPPPAATAAAPPSPAPGSTALTEIDPSTQARVGGSPSSTTGR